MLFAVRNLNIHQTNNSVHCVNTRQQNKLHIPLVRLSLIQRSVYYPSVKIFDQLTHIYSNFVTTNIPVKTLLRDYLAKNAIYSIEEFISV